jgi:hypothetical protein
MNRTAEPPGTRPSDGLRIVTLAVRLPCAGAAGAAGAEVATGVTTGVAAGDGGVAGPDGVLAGDALAAAGARLALDAAGDSDEQPLTMAIAATAKAAGIATRLTAAAVRERRAVAAGLAALLMGLSLPGAGVTAVGVAGQRRANNFSRKIPGVFLGSRENIPG